MMRMSVTNLVKTIESSRADKENVGGVNLNGLSSGLPSCVLLRDVYNGALHHFQHALLDPLSTNISKLVDPRHSSNLVNLDKLISPGNNFLIDQLPHLER